MKSRKLNLWKAKEPPHQAALCTFKSSTARRRMTLVLRGNINARFAAIRSTLRADTMRDMIRATAIADHKVIERERIVRAALVAAAA
jgi:hypothetical protein